MNHITKNHWKDLLIYLKQEHISVLQILHKLLDVWTVVIHKEFTVNFTTIIAWSSEYWLYRIFHSNCSVWNAVHYNCCWLLQLLHVCKSSVHNMFCKFIEVLNTTCFANLLKFLTQFIINIFEWLQVIYLNNRSHFMKKNIYEDSEEARSSIFKCICYTFLINETDRDLYTIDIETIKNKLARIRESYFQLKHICIIHSESNQYQTYSNAQIYFSKITLWFSHTISLDR